MYAYLSQTLLLTFMITLLTVPVNAQETQHPRTVQQAVITLAEELNEETRQQYREMEEEAFVGYGISLSDLGSTIISRWELGGHNTLSSFFNNQGLHTPTEMAEVILTSLHRYLNGRPMRLHAQIREMRAFWEGEEP
ncbi:hypothetical protein CYPRO_3161 [Cyclonatronum proteinivorum]|uniref:DUF6794 domain-containing protein n=1 Tax=Cyclonatronum proteinivorum TaxID=1457365 RepID=A0A345UPJ3_9BACT|nr:DUF6794 domain-containing protein [Cyclonatronum proteinivorum]AXJ02395.1 hypothetical protein CYPRO_3161 [Cyclonatronum proteinivorum]